MKDKIYKVSKVFCVLVMIANVLVLYLKALNGESITVQLIGIPLLFVAYKLICFSEKK